MLRALFLIGLALTLVLGAGSANASRLNNGTAFADKVVKYVQQAETIVAGAHGKCSKIEAGFKSFAKTAAAKAKAFNAQEKKLSAADKVAYAQEFVTKGAPLIAQIEKGVTVCGTNPAVQASMTALGQMMGGG